MFCVFSGVVICVSLFVAANGAECNITSDDLLVDWDNLFLNGISSEFDSISMSQTSGLDSNGVITITLNVAADYRVLSIYESLMGDDTQYGFAYILDSYMFEDSGRLIKNANPCENRLQSSFANLTSYSEYWTYTLNPNELGNDSYGLEYPNPNIWSISGDCNTVTWTHTFTFDELSNQCGFTWTDSGDTFDLKGEFYLTGVSPNPLLYSAIANGNDNGNYLTSTLISEEITISFQKSITIISDANVDLFGSYVLSIDYDEDNDLFEITILTYVPNYMALDDSGSNKQVTTNNIITDATYSINEDSSYNGQDCLLNDNYRCWQKFIITIDLIECPQNTILSLSGDYTFLTEFKCIGLQSACDEYYSNTNNDLESSIITLDSISLTYNENCDDHTIYDITFSGTLDFYNDNTFTTLKEDSFNSNGEIVYVQINLDNTLSSYNILGMIITGITLCTADIDDDNIITSCTDSNVDASLFYDVINDATTNYNLINSDNTDSIEQFSFNLPVLSDDRFFIDAKVEITLNNNNNQRRMLRLVLLQNDDESTSINAITNFVGSAQIARTTTADTAVDTADTSETDDIIDTNNSGSNDNDDSINSIGIILSIIGGCSIIAICVATAIIYSVRMLTNPKHSFGFSQNAQAMGAHSMLHGSKNNFANNNNANNNYYHQPRSRTASVSSMADAQIPPNMIMNDMANNNAIYNQGQRNSFSNSQGSHHSSGQNSRVNTRANINGANVEIMPRIVSPNVPEVPQQHVQAPQQMQPIAMQPMQQQMGGQQVPQQIHLPQQQQTLQAPQQQYSQGRVQKTVNGDIVINETGF